ncbi:CBL-interacting protein kinase 1-like [Iris pallida]|uniref:CBL-interacting protein kinase 1-like n=1 Tax=Iris pallida TaxID=29817 RepID=A0AAX6EP53_IRIPA|nr:CBL-interacting protein kinase 1-like [Iris pallida]
MVTRWQLSTKLDGPGRALKWEYVRMNGYERANSAQVLAVQGRAIRWNVSAMNFKLLYFVKLSSIVKCCI